MRNDYRFDFITKTIIFNKGFYDKACKSGTDENKELIKVIEKYPNMEIAIRKTSPRKTTASPSKNKGLTYKYMRSFITNLDPDNLLAFEEVIQYHKKFEDNSATVYRRVADWFLRTYPNHADMIVEAEPQATTKQDIMPIVPEAV